MTEPEPRFPQPRPVRSRHTRVEPVRGNARRRTIVLLAATGAVVLGVHFAIADDPSGRTSGPSAGSAGQQSAKESTKAAASGGAPTFYVSAAGDDAADGTTAGTAWKTLARADQHTYLPGEQLLLRGGDTFAGTITLKAGEAGSADKPVVVGSYGTGPAVIRAGQTPAIAVHNTAGVTVKGLTLVGDGALKSPEAGVDLYNDLPGDVQLAGLTLTGLDVSGFRDGVSIVGGSGSSGFSGIEVSDSKLHGNRDNGLVSAGPPGAPLPKGKHQFRGVHVNGVQAYDNLGNPANHQTSTGSGIDLGGIDTGVIENSLAYNNGGLCDSANGPVGIWIHDATDVTIRHNVSRGNRTAGYTDGGGFDIDQSTHDTVMEHNLTYDNWGPGYMVYSSSTAQTSTGNVLRYNVSIDDAVGPKNADSITYGAMMLAGFEKDLTVHHNTIQQTAKTQTSTLLNLGGHLAIGLHLQNTAIRDNIFAAGGGAFLDAGQAPTVQQVAMQGNTYHSATGRWRMKWGGTTISSLANWRKTTGQEQLHGTATGTDADPVLAAAGSASWDPTQHPVPAPKAGTASTSALDLTALFGTDLGGVDYFGNPVQDGRIAGGVARGR